MIEVDLLFTHRRRSGSDHLGDEEDRHAGSPRALARSGSRARPPSSALLTPFLSLATLDG